MVTGLLALSAVGGMSSTAFGATNNANSAVSATQKQDNVKIETQVINGEIYTIKWNTKDDSIKIFDSKGKMLGATTISEVRAKYKEATKSIPRTATYGPNACSVTLGVAGIANGILWTAAGLTAVAPPAAIAAGAGGVVTGGILTVGSMFC